MTRRNATLVLGVAVATSLLFGLLLVARLDASRARAVTAIAAAERTERDVARLVSLRGVRQTVATGREPHSDALALLNAAMSHANVSASHVRSLTPVEHGGLAAESAAPGYEHRSLRLVLAGLSMPALGRFLCSWRDTQAIWSIREISLRNESSRPDTEPHWTATMTLTATYWPGLSAEGGGP